MMHRVPQAGLTLPAVARRGLSEGLGVTARCELSIACIEEQTLENTRVHFSNGAVLMQPLSCQDPASRIVQHSR